MSVDINTTTNPINADYRLFKPDSTFVEIKRHINNHLFANILLQAGSSNQYKVAIKVEEEIKLIDTELTFDETDSFQTMLASEKVLAKDWNDPEEDEIWAYL